MPRVHQREHVGPARSTWWKMKITRENAAAVRELESKLHVLALMRGGRISDARAVEAESAVYAEASRLLALHNHPIIGRLLQMTIAAVKSRDAESLSMVEYHAAAAAEITHAVAASTVLKRPTQSVRVRPLTLAQKKCVDAFLKHHMDSAATAAALKISRQAVEDHIKKAKERQPGLIPTRIGTGRRNHRLIE